MEWKVLADGNGGYEIRDDRDTCRKCGKDLRNPIHLRADES